MPPEARRRIAEETLDIYAPLAGRMGMHEMREELEDLAFRELNPEAYAVVSERLDALRSAQRAAWSPRSSSSSTKKLAERGIDGRGVGPAQARLFDLAQDGAQVGRLRAAVGHFRLSRRRGARCRECYQALGIVHTTWPVVPGRFKDYISTPKQNDYRSIHTTVIGPGKQRVELQIRTSEMHEIAEYGIAAHALYKDGVGSPTEMLSREVQRLCLAAPHHRAAGRRLEPGRVSRAHQARAVPRPGVLLHAEGQADRACRAAPTPIDFAYAVHTDVGNMAVGCKINGKIAPLVSELANGDEVEIITSKAQTAPPAAWESLVVTGKARAAIRRATRAAVRKQYAGLGRRIVERLCQRAKIAYSDEKLQGALPRLARASVEDVMSAVGRGEMRAADVVRAMYPDYKEERAAAIASSRSRKSGWFGLKQGQVGEFKVPDGEAGAAIPIRGISSDLPVRFAPNGGAVPGDRIVGILTPGRGHHDLSDPVAGAEGLRGHAGALARRALGHGRAHAAALSRRALRCRR